MNKVRIFNAETTEDLQEQIDVWIEEQKPNVIFTSPVSADYDHDEYIISIMYDTNVTVSLNS